MFEELTNVYWILDVGRLYLIDHEMAFSMAYSASEQKASLLDRIDEEGCGVVFAAARAQHHNLKLTLRP